MINKFHTSSKCFHKLEINSPLDNLGGKFVTSIVKRAGDKLLERANFYALLEAILKLCVSNDLKFIKILL